jgi:hypothetical protein
MSRLPAAAIVFLRFALVLCLGLPAATAPGRAEPAGRDGFSICAFAKSARGIMQSTIGPCQLLTAQALQSFSLSARETAIVAALQSFAPNPSFNLPQRLAKATALAAPRLFAAAGNFSDYWFPDVTHPDNAELGIHMRYLVEGAKPQLHQMTYAVDGGETRFTVLWNRALVVPPR